MKQGDRVSWMSANGIRSGVVEGTCNLGLIVRLENTKVVIVQPDSLIYETQRKPQ